MRFIPTEQLYWWALGILCLFFCSSCGRSYYHPSEAYLLGVAEAGELKAAVAYLGDRHFQQYQGHVAWSPVKRLALVGNYFQQGDPRIESSPGTHWKLRMGEVALGTYNKWKFKNQSGYLLLDGYLGMGLGQSKQRFNEGFTIVTADYKRYFLHLGFHTALGKHFQFSTGVRGVYLNYKGAEVFGKLLPEEHYEVINRIGSANPFFLTEGSVRISGGLKKVHLYASLSGYVIPNTPFDLRHDFSRGPTIQGGLIFQLHEIFKRHK